jgi:hypothetical protein
LERFQTVTIGVLLGCTFVAVGAARPDWLATLQGMIIPTLPKYEDWVIDSYPAIAGRPTWVEIATYLGAIGGGTYDYVGYIGFLREKAWGAIGLQQNSATTCGEERPRELSIDTSAENLQRGRRWLLPAKIDTGASFFCVWLYAICFAVLGAVVLRPQQIVPSKNDLLTHQAQFMTDVHPGLLYVYQLGIFMAFFGSVYGSFEIYIRTASECFRPLSARLREMPFERFRRGMLLYCAVLALVVLWSMSDPIKIITPAALVGGVFSCGLWCFAMIWIDRRFLPHPLRMGPTLLFLSAVSGVLFSVLGIKAIWDYLAELGV